MNEENEKTKRFGFAQFRFVVAGILFLAAGLKAYQLATAPLPPVAPGSVFTPLLELLNNRNFLMTVVVGEILFALILVVDIWRQWAWFLSLLGFSAFALISMIKGLSGESSCGCFGTVTVNPWITMGLDLVIVAFLAVFRERVDWTFPPVDCKKVLIVLIAWLVLAGLALFGMLSLKQQPHATIGQEIIGADGRKMIVLEPETWIGKEFPLIPRFTQPEGAEILREGTWNVLLVQPGCSDCQEMIRDLEEKKPDNVAIVVIPARGSEKALQTSFPTFVLDGRNDWFAETPCVVQLLEGVCIEIGGRRRNESPKVTRCVSAGKFCEF